MLIDQIVQGYWFEFNKKKYMKIEGIEDKYGNFFIAVCEDGDLIEQEKIQDIDLKIIDATETLQNEFRNSLKKFTC